MSRKLRELKTNDDYVALWCPVGGVALESSLCSAFIVSQQTWACPTIRCWLFYKTVKYKRLLELLLHQWGAIYILFDHHILFHLQGDYEVKVNLDTGNLRDLRNKLSSETGIPAHVLHAKWVQFYTYACLVNSFYFFFLAEKKRIIFPLNDQLDYQEVQFGMSNMNAIDYNK